MVRDVITEQTHLGLELLYSRLYDEVVYHLYAQGKGKPGSPAKALRGYGFKSKVKKNLLKEVAVYLGTVEVIPMDIRESNK